MSSPYRSLEVVETVSRIFGKQWWVRDEESAAFWLVEYVGKPGRLTCYCPDGDAHAEAPDTEDPCAHLTAVVDERMAQQMAAGPKLGVLKPAVFCD